MKYAIKNWSEFQQYKDDRPLHWIKLHTKLLTDYKFNGLPETTQLHLLKLWLVAAGGNGELEGDCAWMANLINTKKLNLELLVRNGFIVRTEVVGGSVPREEESREEKRRVNGRFTPPTHTELQNYLNEKNLTFPPNDFIDHFTSNGWKVGGKAPMKDWRAAARQWDKRQYDFHPEKKPVKPDLSRYAPDGTPIADSEGKLL